uniref:Regulator of telomere elongation helicase 1 homolog n=1 Tax=Kalanchoe fedtschenkoi TaxID=63787 RepID=A0A7N0VD81_KALFE
MPIYRIRGIDVDFPFEAYDCQLVYMEKVIQSLQDKCNALLESPTGTGKTLCLLCATLAWRKSLGPFSTGKSCKREERSSQSSQSEGQQFPTIVYTSRTHSQLRQVIQELKRTNYRPKMVVLGSREQLCIHEEVSQLRGKAQTNACHFVRKKRKKNRCAHYPRVTDYLKSNPQLGDEPVDIEDLVNIGRSCGACPYYISRELHKVVDILFAPYNYLIDRGFRGSLTMGWSNSVLIFDEAHNLESQCSDAASFDLPASHLTACITEVTKCIDIAISRRGTSSDKSCDPDTFAILRALLLKLERRIAEIPINSKELGFTKPGPYIYEFLAELNITDHTAQQLIQTIEEAVVLLQEGDGQNRNAAEQKDTGTTFRLENMGDILRMIFKDGLNYHASSYRMHVQEVEKTGPDVFKGKMSRMLSWWCFNPGIAMEEFSQMGVGSIILTSGTLSPMNSFAQELKIDFPIRLENPHVISPSQIWVGVVPVGPSGCSFNSSYRNRDTKEYKQELGNAIVNFARIVPDGVLVFFPSYYLLDQCVGFWKNGSTTGSATSSSIWERICRHKQPVVEPRQSSLFSAAINDYMTKLRDSTRSGAIFFAVCRGKVSEGLDFADQAGRAVIITGMPFATLTDPKVRLKREYLDEQAHTQMAPSQALTGEEWYNQQASRAVNQAVGRVIRHRHDYGAIIFCDERFAQSNRQSQTSLWIRPHIECHSRFGDVVFSLTRFFREGVKPDLRKVELTRTNLNSNSLRKPLLGDTTAVLSSANELSIDENISSKPKIGAETETAEYSVKLQSDKILLSAIPPGNKNFPAQSLSAMLQVKRGGFSTPLADVPPANRSTLTGCMQTSKTTIKCSNDLLSKKRKLPASVGKTTHRDDQDVVDLTSDDNSHYKSSKGLLAPCSSERGKLPKVEAEAASCYENPSGHYLGVRKMNFDSSSHASRNLKLEPRTEDGGTRSHDSSDVTAQRRNPHGPQKTKETLSNSALSSEMSGAAFLAQVKEKLSSTEYKDFVEFMKALKSKAMRINYVLQSIAKIFSGPERLPLRRRFKDYIPAKYHCLYDKYFDEASGSAAHS